MCKVEWCKGKPNISGNGYCRRHYDQIRKWGHILDKRTCNDPNRYEVEGDIIKINITNKNDEHQCTAVIDREDAERVLSHKWTSNGNGYVRTFINTKPLYLHRFLMCAPDGYDVDHINNDTLDNRKSNLRIVNHIENCNNRKTKGSVHHVTNRVLKKPYFAKITLYGRRVSIGYFATEKDAREAIEEYKAHPEKAKHLRHR